MEIQISPNDRDDILELLDSALEYKRLEKSKHSQQRFSTVGYWEIRVPQLKQLINGRKVYDSIMKSTLVYHRRRKDDKCNDKEKPRS